MRMQSGITDQYIYFVAVDATDYVTRETGLATFTVYRSRNGGAATAYTTPTVSELSAANMPGVYSLLLDEDMTIDSGDDSQEICLHITHAGMAPVTRTIELYRPIVTAGQTITVANGAADADLERIQGTVVNTPSVAGVLEVDVTHFNGTAGTFAAGRPEVNMSHISGAAVSTTSAQIGVNIVQISADSVAADNLEAYCDGTTPMPVNATQISGDAIAADNCELFFDGTGYNAANSTVGTVTTVTTATNVTTVNGLAANVITAASTAADYITEIQSGLATSASIAALNNLSAAQVNAEVDTALADIRLDELLAADSDIDGAAPPTVGSVFHELMTKTAGSFTYDQTTDSLEALRDRGDAAWITATGFSTLTQADIRTAVGLGAANLDTQLTAIDDFLDTEIAAIKAKTDNLPADPADASDIAASFVSTNALITTVDTVVDAIKVQTDKLTFTVANQIDANIQYVNDVEVIGNGETGTEWGPA